MAWAVNRSLQPTARDYGYLDEVMQGLFLTEGVFGIKTAFGRNMHELPCNGAWRPIFQRKSHGI